jgi:hypothetical protein
MLMHNNWFTGLDYMEETLSYLAHKGWYDIDSAKFSTYCPLPIKGESHPDPMCYVFKQFRTIPLSTLSHSRYIV